MGQVGERKIIFAAYLIFILSSQLCVSHGSRLPRSRTAAKLETNSNDV